MRNLIILTFTIFIKIPAAKWCAGVAVSNMSEGPFTDNGIIEGTDGSNPACFVDDAGQCFLYWGEGFEAPELARLKVNMRELDEKPRRADFGDTNFLEEAFVFRWRARDK